MLRVRCLQETDWASAQALSFPILRLQKPRCLVKHVTRKSVTPTTNLKPVTAWLRRGTNKNQTGLRGLGTASLPRDAEVVCSNATSGMGVYFKCVVTVCLSLSMPMLTRYWGKEMEVTVLNSCRLHDPVARCKSFLNC